ncbi:hypothetical protein M422DRAFT_262846 [Sphaerobolus stellatus SS14]|uniref:Unplaced genomic scaffold SPHSTscaffold_119, whole genome shotgun sequence n=1 Tax=Sphaerobolus stellatus (strain SS14) TaxID=990650 RepID=A0A0C9UZY4_SPHS4|nr:hypothetical protein M422DRAFT_262846 [Sphaerobolus stellatus SS14]
MSNDAYTIHLVPEGFLPSPGGGLTVTAPAELDEPLLVTAETVLHRSRQHWRLVPVADKVGEFQIVQGIPPNNDPELVIPGFGLKTGKLNEVPVTISVTQRTWVVQLLTPLEGQKAFLAVIKLADTGSRGIEYCIGVSANHQELVINPYVSSTRVLAKKPKWMFKLAE